MKAHLATHSILLWLEYEKTPEHRNKLRADKQNAEGLLSTEKRINNAINVLTVLTLFPERFPLREKLHRRDCTSIVCPNELSCSLCQPIADHDDDSRACEQFANLLAYLHKKESIISLNHVVRLCFCNHIKNDLIFLMGKVKWVYGHTQGWKMPKCQCFQNWYKSSKRMCHEARKTLRYCRSQCLPFAPISRIRIA